jgi:ATP-dependent DNA helicase RecQ
VLRQLAAQGLVEIDVEGHGGMSLAGDCRAVLRGERRVELRRDPTAAPRAGKARTAPRLTALGDPEAEGLFQRLREWRLRIARVQGVPPYVIFHDATLLAIAAARPRSRRDLESLPGLGAAKLERYGDALLTFLAE